MITQILKTSLLMKQEENLILRQNDVGNEIVFLFDANLDNITSAEFRLIKPDNTFVILTGTVEENMATFTITEQCCIIPGRCHFNLRLINSASNIYTYVSNCIIDINLNLEDAIESTAEANGYIFPDDFLTSADLSNYATKTYVNDAVAEVPIYTPPNYSTTEQDTGIKWIDGKPIYQRTFIYNQEITINYSDWTNTGISSDGIDVIIDGMAGDYGYGGVSNRGVTWGCINVSKVVNDGYLSALTGRNGDAIQIDCLTLRYTKTTD